MVVKGMVRNLRFGWERLTVANFLVRFATPMMDRKAFLDLGEVQFSSREVYA
jgi:hypothetical protein